MNALGPMWICRYHHDKESSSWWGERTVRAQNAKLAAERCIDLVDDHAGYKNPGLRVRVYGPVPEEISGEFWVAKKSHVEAIYEEVTT